RCWFLSATMPGGSVRRGGGGFGSCLLGLLFFVHSLFCGVSYAFLFCLVCLPRRSVRLVAWRCCPCAWRLGCVSASVAAFAVRLLARRVVLLVVAGPLGCGLALWR